MIKIARFLVSANMALFAALPSAAHEFWIDPSDYTLSVGDQIAADLRVGENFAGSVLSYLPRNFTRFEIALGDSVTPVEGRLGDRPALGMALPGAEGLAVVLHETTDNLLTYDNWNTFVAFVEHKDMAGVLERHRARGLPETGFTEAYSRHVKSLIALGEGAGQDRAFGLRTEFVALANPYVDTLENGLPVLLLMGGEPRANAQVELWRRAPDGAVTVSIHRTDGAGEVSLPAEPGNVYMADAVAMLEVAPTESRNVVWHSIWASLTFAVPAERPGS